MASTLETMFPHSLVPPTVMNARVFLPVLLVMKVMKFSLTERALRFATLKELLSTARMTNHANFAINLSKTVFFAMKMAPNVPNVQPTLKFSPTERALIFATLKEVLSTARKTNHANFAMNLSKAVFFAMKMAPNVPNVMTTLIFTKGFVTLNALLMSTVKSH